MRLHVLSIHVGATRTFYEHKKNMREPLTSALLSTFVGINIYEAGHGPNIYFVTYPEIRQEAVLTKVFKGHGTMLELVAGGRPRSLPYRLTKRSPLNARGFEI